MLVNDLIRRYERDFKKLWDMLNKGIAREVKT